MAERIIAMRERLYDLLVELKTPGEWGHIKSQIGMSSVALVYIADQSTRRHVLLHWP